MASASKVNVWNRALICAGISDLVESETEERPDAAVLRAVYDDVLREVLEARPWLWAMRQRPLSNIDEQEISYDGDGATTQLEVPYAFLETTQIEVVQINGSSETTLDPADDYTVTPAAAGNNAYITVTPAVPVGQSLRITVTTERTGWEHIYPLPSDCVTPVALLHQGQRYELSPHDARNEWTVMANDASDGMLLCANVDAADIDGLQYVALIDHVAMWPAHFIKAMAWRLAVELALGIHKDEARAKRYLDTYREVLSEATAQSMNLEQQTMQPDTPSIRARA